MSRVIGGEEKFTFSANPEQNVHAFEPESGRVLIYEDRKREVMGQLDFQRDLRRVQSQHMDLWAFELGQSTMLLLEYCSDGSWRRIGVAWDMREDYFTGDECRTLILR